MARKHVKVEPARWYYWCDKLGFLVWQDMPSAMTRTPPSNVRKGAAEDAAFPAEIASSLGARVEERDPRTGERAHRMIAWVPFNEGWGQHVTNDVLKMVKALDPTRLVDGPSGWEDRGWRRSEGHALLSRPGNVPGNERPGQRAGRVRRAWDFRSKDTCGGTSAIGATGRSKIARNCRPVRRPNEKLEPLVKQGLAAAIYTQTTDVEGEVNGLMTYDRKVVKFDAAKLAVLHRKLIQSVPR